MKKNQLYKLFALCLSLIMTNGIFGQGVGINLLKGQTGSVFQIDAAGDNSSSITAAEALNDVVIMNTGRVGIGTASPTNQLHIKTASGQGALRISDGAEKASRVLYSLLDGSGLWSPYGSYTLVEIPLGANQTFALSQVNGVFKYSGTSFQLDPGIWMIDLQLLVYHDTGSGSTNSTNYNDRAWFKFGISDTGTSWGSSADHISGTATLICDFLYKVGASYNMIPGVFFLNNQTSAKKTYYLWFGGGSVNSGTIPATEKFVLATAANESIITATYLGNSYHN